MTKAILRSLLKNTLKSLDKTSIYHDTYLDYMLEQAINSVFYTIHAQTPKALGQYTKRYTVQDIDSDLDTGRYYVSLPVDLIPLPDKRGGVRAILSDISPTTYFSPVTDQELLLMEESDADNLITTSPIVVYFVTRNDIIEFKGMTDAMAMGQLAIDYLVAFHDLADTDIVGLPYGKDYEVIGMVLKMLDIVPPKDLLDNNASTAQ